MMSLWFVLAWNSVSASTFSGGSTGDIEYDQFSRSSLTGPLVFVMHGRNQDRSQVKEIGKELGCRGYNAITFDQFGHRGGNGQPGVPSWDNGNANYAADMYTVMQKSAEEIGVMMAQQTEFGFATDTERDVGVVGVSMGGHA